LSDKEIEHFVKQRNVEYNIFMLILNYCL